MKQSFIEPDERTLKARKFLVWLFVISSFMFFAALTSGFIVYTAGSAQRGLKTTLPSIFMYSTAAILLSSITMHLAYLAGKRFQVALQRKYLIATMALGALFFILQLSAWDTLIKQGIYFVNLNASQSFLYIFTGAHLVHIIFGVGMLAYVLYKTFIKHASDRNVFRLEATSIFWHFIDILWIYLYVFLILAD